MLRQMPAAGSTIKLGKETIVEYLNSNIALKKSMIENGFKDARPSKVACKKSNNGCK